jgi:hypothetical protein
MSSLIGRLMRRMDWDREVAAAAVRHRWRWLRRYTKRKRQERRNAVSS